MKRAQRRADRRAAESEEVAPRALGPVLSFMRALWGVNHGLESTSRRMKVRLGVTGPERIVIRLVGRFAGISAGELARILRVHPSTLTGLVKRLSRRGLLLRSPDPADARRALLTLTSKGEAVDGERHGTVEAAVTSALDALSPCDVRAAVTVLDALARAMDR